MTVASTLAKAGPYVCDGAQDTFPFAFPVLDASHVAVYLGSGDTERRLSEGFTVSLTDNGGNVVFDIAPAEGARVAILRDTPYDQQVDLQNNTAFYPELLESMSDKLTMLVQQLREELSRCVKLAVASGESPESVVEMILGAKDMALDSASTAASAAAACSSAQLTIATIWAEITGDSASAEAAIDALREAWEAAGSVAAAAEAGKASVNEASLAAVEYAKGQITEAQDASLGVLSATTKSRKEELLALIAETVGAEGTVAAAVQAAKDAAEAAAEESGKIETLSASVQASISAAVTVADQKKQEAQTAANEAAAQAEAAGDSAATAYSYIAQTLANKNAALAAQAAAEAAKADAVAAAGSASTAANASVTAHNASSEVHKPLVNYIASLYQTYIANYTAQNAILKYSVSATVNDFHSMIAGGRYFVSAGGEWQNGPCSPTAGWLNVYAFGDTNILHVFTPYADPAVSYMEIFAAGFGWTPWVQNVTTTYLESGITRAVTRGSEYDLNNLTDLPVYASYGGTAANIPVEAFQGFVVNRRDPNGWISQSAIHFYTGDSWTRAYNPAGQSWSPWVKIMNATDAASRTCYPNYAARIDIKAAIKEADYTVPQDGWAFIYINMNAKLYVNGALCGQGIDGGDSIFIPLKSGDVITKLSAHYAYFFPNR